MTSRFVNITIEEYAVASSNISKEASLIRSKYNLHHNIHQTLANLLGHYVLPT